MSKDIRHRMSVRHEEDVANDLRGRKSRGSGNQFRDQMDGRNNRYDQPFAFAWDCKATLSKSVSIPRTMTAKAVEQADGERPLIPIRFYDDESLRSHEDWVLVRWDDFLEIEEIVNATTPSTE